MKNIFRAFTFLFVLCSGVFTFIKINKTNKQMIANETTSFQVKQTLQAVAATLEKSKEDTPEALDSTAQSSPQIKGNRNARGEYIYHLPGGAFYERTNPVEWFHSEEEAQSKGYRKSAR